MTAPTPSAQQIASNVEQDTQACHKLLELLEAERTALAERNLERLEEIIREKANHLTQLEKGATQRTLWLQSEQNPSAADAASRWEQLLARSAPALSRHWQDFRNLLSRCQSENDINGKLLARNQQVFARIISIVRGQQNNLDTYSASAKSKPAKSSGQYLGEA